MRAGTARHFVDVMRPAASPLGSRGQPKGQDAIHIKGWPCNITPTGSAESDQSSGSLSEATYEVEGWGDPERPIRGSDYLLFNGRRLDISSVIDRQMNGLDIFLTCGEHLEPASG